MNYKLPVAFRRRSNDQGFTLPVAVAMGLVMFIASATLVSRSQSDQVIASARRGTGGSLAVAEGGIARTLAQLTQANNAVLLTRNYDAVNPTTGKTYLGPDAILSNGDEESTAVNWWTGGGSGSSPCTGATTGSPSMSYSGTIGTDGEYTLQAYRYNSTSKTGTFLVQGRQGTSAARIAVTVAINSTASDFPGVLAVETISLLGRSAVGTNGNVYYDPAFSAEILA